MKDKSHYEMVSARIYYGRHATGSVLLRNGHVVIHDKTHIVKKFYESLKKGD